MREYISNSINLLGNYHEFIKKQTKDSDEENIQLNNIDTLLTEFNELENILDFVEESISKAYDENILPVNLTKLLILVSALIQKIGEVKFYKKLSGTYNITESTTDSKLLTNRLQSITQNDYLDKIYLKYPSNKVAFSGPPLKSNFKIFTAPLSYYKVLHDIYINLIKVYCNYQYLSYPHPSVNLFGSIEEATNEIECKKSFEAYEDFKRDFKLLGAECLITTAEQNKDQVEQAISKFSMTALLKATPNHHKKSISETLIILELLKTEQPEEYKRLENDAKDLTAYLKSRGGQHFSADALIELKNVLDLSEPNKHGEKFDFSLKRKMEWSINDIGEIELQIVLTPFAILAHNISKTEFNESYPAYLAIDRDSKKFKYFSEQEANVVRSDINEVAKTCQPLAQQQIIYTLKPEKKQQTNNLDIKLELKSHQIMIFSDLLKLNTDYLNNEKLIETQQSTINLTK